MTQWWAHRGVSARAPENSLAAFQLAIDEGVDGVELDVHLSSDGVPVVIHDETVDRTTDGSGNVVDFTAEELASWQVPTLEEVLALLRPTGMGVNVELKNDVQAYPGIENAVLDVCVGWTQRLWFSSFNLVSLRRLRHLGPEVQIGVLFEHAPPGIVEVAISMGAQALHPHFSAVRQVLAPAHARGLRVHAWTVNTPEARELAQGADAIISDDPRAVSTR